MPRKPKPVPPAGVWETLDPVELAGALSKHVDAALLRDISQSLVNHPPHYTSHPSGVECITITRHMGFNLGNVMKYVWRADEKGPSIQDLEKASWYLADEIARRKAAIAEEI